MVENINITQEVIYFVKPMLGNAVIKGKAEGKLIFNDIDLLKESEFFYFSKNKNMVTINVGEFTLHIENYFSKDKFSNYQLIDKNGCSTSIIYEIQWDSLADSDKKAGVKCNKFELSAETLLNNDADIIAHYQFSKRVLRSVTESMLVSYQVFSTIRQIIPGQKDSMKFLGSSGDDFISLPFINNETNVDFVRGAEGSDVYLLVEKGIDKNIVLVIDNYAQDAQIDYLIFPCSGEYIKNLLMDVPDSYENPHLTISFDACIAAAGKIFQLKFNNFFLSADNQHLVVIDEEGKRWYVHEANHWIYLYRYYHFSIETYLHKISLSDVLKDSTMVVNLDFHSINYYALNNDLYLTQKKIYTGKKVVATMILEEFYGNKKHWEQLIIMNTQGVRLNALYLFSQAALAINYHQVLDIEKNQEIKIYSIQALGFIHTITHNQIKTENNSLATVDVLQQRIGEINLEGNLLKIEVIAEAINDLAFHFYFYILSSEVPGASLQVQKKN